MSGVGRAAPTPRQATATAAQVRASGRYKPRSRSQARSDQHRRAQHGGGARAQHRRRGGGAAAVVGVVDKADHRGAHRGDGGGERQVAEYPLHAGSTFRSGAAPSGEVEVCPPGAEADHHGDQPDGEGEPADRLGGQSADDTGEGFAEHDDDERPEPFGERVGDDQRGRLRWACREDHGGDSGQVGGVDQAPGGYAGAGREQGGEGQQGGAGRRPGDEQPAGPGRYSGRSPRAASSHRTASTANSVPVATANAAPRAPPACGMKAPIAASTRICSRNVLRARASSWPCRSWCKLPLAQAIHTSVNTTVNSPSPRQVRCPASRWAAWATSTTTARS
jgi:hypothetical protein